MDNMITFCSAILQEICVFLATPPVFYLFALFCFAVIVSIVRSLIKNH